MRIRRFVVVGTVAFVCATRAQAQGIFDSLAVLRTLGAALRTDARTVVQGFACHDGMHPCRTPAASTPHPLLRAFAEQAGAQLVNDTRAGIPPCPWGWNDPQPPAGYRLGIARVRITADTAHVLVLRHCDNPPGSVHDIFGRDDEYELVRDAEGVWTVHRERMTRITHRGDVKTAMPVRDAVR